MAFLYEQWKYYGDGASVSEKMANDGYWLYKHHTIFQNLDGDIYIRQKEHHAKHGAAYVNSKGEIFLNPKENLSPEQWAYTIVHCLLHLAFGHFDQRNIPYDSDGTFDRERWNLACDIYIARFLADIKYEDAICRDPAEEYTFRLNDERKIYDQLALLPDIKDYQKYGTNFGGDVDMLGLENPVVYAVGEENPYVEQFAETIRGATRYAVSYAGTSDMREREDTESTKAYEWFLSNYPLLGGMAASFQIVKDQKLCHQYEIHIAAVDPEAGSIYINPSVELTEDEWRFVFAHEFLHAGLMHHKRCQGREKFLWNIACDFVINDWLHELRIGTIPEGCLYDPELHGLSCEAVYDIIVQEMRKYSKEKTFRGFKKGDILFDDGPRFHSSHEGVALDEFIKNALAEGLEYHQLQERGYLPAGLVEEIKTLNTPPIPWDDGLIICFHR